MSRKSFFYSLLVTASYLVPGITYIVASGALASAYADSEASLAAIEQIKGVGFIVVTASLLFGLCFLLFRRQELTHQLVVRQQYALDRAERLASLGTMAAAVAHDLRNVLMVVMAYSSELDDAVSSNPGAREMLDGINKAVARIAALAGRMHGASRDSAGATASDVDVARLVRDEVQLLGHHLRSVGLHVKIDAPEPVRARLFPQLVGQAFANLVINATEAVRQGGHVEIRVRQPAPTVILIEVHDDGPGVPQPLRAKILEPLFTTKEQGTGLGMIAVNACAMAHEGTLEIGDSPLGGA